MNTKNDDHYLFRIAVVGLLIWHGMFLHEIQEYLRQILEKMK